MTIQYYIKYLFKFQTNFNEKTDTSVTSKQLIICLQSKRKKRKQDLKV